MSDELYEIRNAFLLGNFAQVISEGSALKLNQYRKADENQTVLNERDALVFKAHIGMGQHDIVIDDLASATDKPMKAIRLLAVYLKADLGNNVEAKSSAMDNAKELLKGVEGLSMATHMAVAITVCKMLIYAEELEAALKVIRSAQAALPTGCQTPACLELHALAIDILLRIHRPDQAEKELRTMHAIDDDAPMYMLAAAWVGLALSGDKIQEAVQLFDDLQEKFGSSVLLLNGKAIAYMSTGDFAQAEKFLLDAMSKRSNDAETLINLISVSQMLRKPTELTNRYVHQLKSFSPNHPWVRQHSALEAKFRAASDQIKSREM